MPEANDCRYPTECKLIPLSSDDVRHIETRIQKLRQWYGTFDLPPCNACNFEGNFIDLSSLDFIFHELGGQSWYWDDGETHAMAWGNVLVRQLGFQWMRPSNEANPRWFAVRNPDVPYIVFPWPRLFELVENPGHHGSVAGDLLLSMITEIDAWLAVPEGWHPVIDAFNNKRPDFPGDIVEMLIELSKCDRDWIQTLGMDPYEWNQGTLWDAIRMSLRCHIQMLRQSHC